MAKNKFHIIFMGRKAGAVKALRWLSAQNISIIGVVAADDRVSIAAKKLKLPMLDGEKLYEAISRKDPKIKNIDLVVSYLYPKKILRPLFQAGRIGCVNFHPAPLPEYKSSAGYNTAILDRKTEYGVSAHFVDSESFDSGPIISVRRFPIDSDSETAFSLEARAQKELLKLFKKVIALFLTGNPIKTIPNVGGLYITRKELEQMKRIDPLKDTSEEIDRKIRAFFFPPYSGATVRIKGEEFTVVDRKVLSYMSKLMNRQNGQ